MKGYVDQSITIMLDHEARLCFVSFIELSDMASVVECLKLCQLGI